MNAYRRTRSADELEVVGKNRRSHAAYRRAGEASSVKRRMRRRERHEAKSQIHDRAQEN